MNVVVVCKRQKNADDDTFYFLQHFYSIDQNFERGEGGKKEDERKQQKIWAWSIIRRKILTQKIFGHPMSSNLRLKI